VARGRGAQSHKARERRRKKEKHKKMSSFLRASLTAKLGLGKLAADASAAAAATGRPGSGG
jgi:hypothetical protein